MTARGRRVLVALLGGWGAAVAVLTLFPTANTPPLTLGGFLCVGCGERDVADIILNWLVFLPGGALMALVLGGKRGVVVAAAFTVTIETLQIGIPGRDPALQDLLSNTLGAMSGVVLVRRGLGARAQGVLAAAAAAAWLSPALLLIPQTSPSVLYGQWTPAFSAVEQYGGRVLEASVGGVPVRTGVVSERDALALNAAIVGRRPIELVVEAGPPPPGIAPVFQVVDDLRSSIVSLGARGEELTLTGRNPARLLRLDQPHVRWSGALQGVAAGDTVAVVVERARDSVCMAVGERRQCRLAPSLGEGWGHLAGFGGLPAWMRGVFTLSWCLGLGLMLGATSRGLRPSLVRGGALAAGGLALCYVAPDVRPDWVHAALLATASLAGGAMREPVATLWSRAAGAIPAHASPSR